MPLPRKSKGRNAKVSFWILFPNSPNFTDANVHQNMYTCYCAWDTSDNNPAKGHKILITAITVVCVVNFSC